VAFNFDRKGVLQISKSQTIEEELFLAATEAGAEGFDQTEEMYIITTDPVELYNVKEGMAGRGFECEETSLEMIPKTLVECNAETAAANAALIEWLEQLDDVDAVYHNMDLPEE
jgi:transcriptional/translational regulatory protein YebC/TACO1